MTKKTDSFWITAVKLQLKHRVLIALLMTIITSIAFYTIITKLKVGTDFFEFYPPQHPY